MKRSGFVLLLVLSLVVSLPAWAKDDPKCVPIGGVLFTNINAIALPSATNGTNLGQVFGDLQGSVAATIVGPDPRGGFDVQHYWVTTSGDTIKFKLGWLKPSMVTPLLGRDANRVDKNVVAVRWGDYIVEFDGGTGKFENAKGYVDCFGLADFANLTLVLRYRGEVCYDSH